MSDPTPQPLDAAQAIWQLRAIVCGLGAAVLVLSVSFNLFVLKQNRNITGAINGRQQQLRSVEARLNETMRLANDLANYSRGKPELTAVFRRHGMELIEEPVGAPTP